MLHRNMGTLLNDTLRLELEDVLGDLHCARRKNDLGRLALLTYWDVRKWARRAHKDALAELAAELFMHQPFPDRHAFLEKVDVVIQELERLDAPAH